MLQIARLQPGHHHLQHLLCLMSRKELGLQVGNTVQRCGRHLHHRLVCLVSKIAAVAGRSGSHKAEQQAGDGGAADALVCRQLAGICQRLAQRPQRLGRQRQRRAALLAGPRQAATQRVQQRAQRAQRHGLQLAVVLLDGGYAG